MNVQRCLINIAAETLLMLAIKKINDVENSLDSTIVFYQQEFS